MGTFATQRQDGKQDFPPCTCRTGMWVGRGEGEREEGESHWCVLSGNTVKILKFGTPQTIAIIVLKIEKLDVTLH